MAASAHHQLSINLYYQADGLQKSREDLKSKIKEKEQYIKKLQQEKSSQYSNTLTVSTTYQQFVVRTAHEPAQNSVINVNNLSFESFQSKQTYQKKYSAHETANSKFVASKTSTAPSKETEKVMSPYKIIFYVCANYQSICTKQSNWPSGFMFAENVAHSVI